MFLGKYPHQLDEKNRIRFPSRFKQEMQKEYVFCIGSSKFIEVIPIKDCEERIAKFTANADAYDGLAQEHLSIFMSSIYDFNEDNQGRVLLPLELRKHANIKKDIITIGVGNSLQIWSAEERALLEEKLSFKESVSYLKRLSER